MTSTNSARLTITGIETLVDPKKVNCLGIVEGNSEVSKRLKDMHDSKSGLIGWWKIIFRYAGATIKDNGELGNPEENNEFDYLSTTLLKSGLYIANLNLKPREYSHDGWNGTSSISFLGNLYRDVERRR